MRTFENCRSLAANEFPGMAMIHSRPVVDGDGGYRFDFAAYDRADPTRWVRVLPEGNYIASGLCVKHGRYLTDAEERRRIEAARADFARHVYYYDHERRPGAAPMTRDFVLWLASSVGLDATDPNVAARAHTAA